jgi:hypothetical protein
MNIINSLFSSKFLKAAALSAAIAYSVGHVSAAVIIPIANGNFEMAGSSAYTSSDANGIVGWTVTQFGEYGDVGVGGPPDGLGGDTSQAAYFFQGTDASPIVMSQTLTGYSLTPGATYNLTLDVGRRYNGTSETLTVDLFAGSNELTWTSTGTNQSPSGPSSPQAWTFTYVAPLSPASGDLKIQLVGTASTSSTDAISFDNINLTEEAPEPSTWALMAMGLPLLVWLLRFKFREADEQASILG